MLRGFFDQGTPSGFKFIQPMIVDQAGNVFSDLDIGHTTLHCPASQYFQSLHFRKYDAENYLRKT